MPRPAAAPLPSSDWRDWPITPGTWRYSVQPRGSVATFGDADAVLTLRCDRDADAVRLTRHERVPGTALVIRTTTVTRTLTTQPAPDGATAVLNADDRLLDAIGYSRGRFIVETPPLATLAVPAWPEILRVVEDCRR